MSQTMIESIVAKADSSPEGAGYHVDAVLSDGSHINAPISQVGPNWASFCEVHTEEVAVDLTGAVVTIDWSPGASFATGPRFHHLTAPDLSYPEESATGFGI